MRSPLRPTRLAALLLGLGCLAQAHAEALPAVVDKVLLQQPSVRSAQALLRSEGYYQPTLQDDVEGEETPVAVVTITPGRRFVLGETTVNWIAPAPDAVTEQVVTKELALTPGEPGRAVLRRQQCLDGGVAVALVYRQSRVVGEVRFQRRGFLRQQLAGSDPVLFAQRMREQPG